MSDIGFDRPDLTTLLARIRADLLARLSADDLLRRSDAEIYTRVMAYAVHSLYAFVEAIAAEILPDMASEIGLERHGAWWGITRKPATKAEFPVTFSCQVGAAIAEGLVLQRPSGGDYVTTGSAPAAGTTITVPVAALSAGSIHNPAVGEVLILVSPVMGVAAQAIAGVPTVVAEDAEDLELWRSRLRARYQAPPHGGNTADYVTWALEVAGVTRAWCYPRLQGNGTVDVTFVMDGRDDIIPTAPDVALVQDHIDQVRPATADVTVFAPVPVALDPQVSLDPANDTPEIRAAVVAELADFIAREAVPAGTIRVSRLREAISAAAGEVWHDLVSPATDVTLSAGQISTLGSVTWLP